jgi:Lysine-specific metallo-endopeptidase
MYSLIEQVLADDGTKWNYAYSDYMETARALRGGNPYNVGAYTCNGCRTIWLNELFFDKNLLSKQWQVHILIHEPSHLFGTRDHATGFSANVALARSWWSFIYSPLDNADTYASAITGK